MESWFVLSSGCGASAFNMGLDEALLDGASLIGRPLLRFYGWIEPAATFGYFQNYSAVQRLTALRPLIRRPTGGGLVPHDADWTYSLVVPPSHAWYALRAIESYRRLHGWLREAFAELNAVTRLAPERHPVGSGQCFVGAEQFDLLDETRKIAGAAQRRNRHGLLIQGSVQPPAGLQRSAWESALCAVAARNWSVRWSPYSLPDELAEHANELARRKYARAEYTQQRTAFRA